MFITWAILGEGVAKFAPVEFALSAAGVYMVVKRLS